MKTFLINSVLDLVKNNHTGHVCENSRFQFLADW